MRKKIASNELLAVMLSSLIGWAGWTTVKLTTLQADMAVVKNILHVQTTDSSTNNVCPQWSLCSKQ